MQNNQISAVSAMNKAIFGVTIKTNTEPKMRKTNNPYFGRVRKISTYTNAILGVEYQNAVNNRLERGGMEANYVAEAPKGKKQYNAFFYQSLKDESVFYLKIGMYKNTEVKSVYEVDGRAATNEEVAEIKTFLQTSDGNVKKQQDAGLENEEQYRIVAPKFENVVSITLGEKVIG